MKYIGATVSRQLYIVTISDFHACAVSKAYDVVSESLMTYPKANY